MNKPIHLWLKILEISKIVLFEFFCEYSKLKYGGKIKLCYVDIDNVITYIKIEDIYINIAKDVETKFNTLNYK